MLLKMDRVIEEGGRENTKKGIEFCKYTDGGTMHTITGGVRNFMARKQHKDFGDVF